MSRAVHAIAAVLDTNAFLELLSDLDVVRSYQRNGEDLTAPDPLYRIRRARASWLMAMVVHEQRQGTLSHLGELERKIRQIGPPPIDEDATHLDWSQGMAWSFTHFIRPCVMPGWELLGDDDEPDVQGEDADTWLLEQAKAHGVPLITNEGVARSGFRDGYARGDDLNLRGRAKQAGAAVYAPIEFVWASNAEPEDLAHRFIDHFIREAPPFAKSRPNPGGVLSMLQDQVNLYRLLLLGMTADDKPNLEVEWPRQAP